ncbi:MAG: hypothetical protein ACTHZ9_01355 [Leucobacter sp.]
MSEKDTEENDKESSLSHGRTSRRRVLIGAIVLAAGLIGITAVGVAGVGLSGVTSLLPGAEETKAPPEPVPAAPLTGNGELDDDEAATVIQHVLAVPFKPVETAEDFRARMGSVAETNYLAELEAQWQELVTNGWSITGEPEVVSAKVSQLGSSDGALSANVTACVDSSAVRTLDAEGAPLGEGLTPRALQHFTLTQGTDEHWRIASRSFPDDPEC